MKRHILAATTAVSFLLPNFAHAEDVSARLRALEQEIAILKRQQEVKEEINQSKSAKQANVEYGAKGLVISSPDKEYQLKLRGYAQVDGRAFLGDDNNTGKDEIIARRLRPVIESKAGDFEFRLMPDFAGSSFKLFDAYADYKPTEAANLRVGKYKPPVGLERLQSATNLNFIERGLPTNLAPNRDFGAQIYGSVFDKALDYQVGLFNGTPDLGNNESDGDDGKDVVGRIFAKPFIESDSVALRGFGVGIGGSVGDRQGTTAASNLGDYRSPGQQTVFRYLSGTTAATTVVADGQHWRAYPQGYYYYGPFGVIGEYAVSNQEVTKGTTREKLQHRAWQLSGSYVLTGEDGSFDGVKPTEDFSLEKGGWGAWEVVGRFGQLDLDDDAFPVFANITSSVTKETSGGVGVNWYLNKNVKWMLDYDLTRFDGGAATGDRPDEHAVFTRVQYQF